MADGLNEVSDILDDILKQEENAEDLSSEVINYYKYVTPLSSYLSSRFDTAKSLRRTQEETWLDNLRQYKGIYDPSVLSNLDTNRSKAFVRITRSRVKLATARMLDILFPANGTKNWGLRATPLPEVHPETQLKLMSFMEQQEGMQIDQDTFDYIIHSEIEKARINMEETISDALEELNYREIVKKTIHSGNLYGTGIIKGVLAKEEHKNRWIMQGDSWVLDEVIQLKPYIEFIPIWNIYLDNDVTDPEDMKYVFQRHIYSRKQLSELSKRSDFNSAAITAYMQAYPEGNANWLEYETTLRTLGNTDYTCEAGRGNAYELVEFWGYVPTKDLIEYGINIPEEYANETDLVCNVWLLDQAIIKLNISPINSQPLPYFIYYFDKNEDSIYGEGIASILSDTQSLLNASVRAMLDNAAISAGPIFETNIDLLASGEDPEDIYPFRVFQRSGDGALSQGRAVNMMNMSSHTNELMNMGEYFHNLSDEVINIPRQLQGDLTSLSAVGRTSSGLSMMMGTSHIALTEQVKNYDSVTSGFIKAMYYWFMEYGERNDIRGDYEVVAMGTSALIDNDLKLQNYINFLNITSNPIDIQRVNRDVILKNIARLTGIYSEGVLKSPQEMRIIDQANAQEAEENKEFERELQKISHQPKEVTIAEHQEEKEQAQLGMMGAINETV